MKAVADTERCKECGLCVNDCPKEAISMTNELNKRGYKYTKVDEQKCIGCGICYTVCPDGVYTIEE